MCRECKCWKHTFSNLRVKMANGNWASERKNIEVAGGSNDEAIAITQTFSPLIIIITYKYLQRGWKSPLNTRNFSNVVFYCECWLEIWSNLVLCSWWISIYSVLEGRGVGIVCANPHPLYGVYRWKFDPSLIKPFFPFGIRFRGWCYHRRMKATP